MSCDYGAEDGLDGVDGQGDMGGLGDGALEVEVGRARVDDGGGVTG